MTFFKKVTFSAICVFALIVYVESRYISVVNIEDVNIYKSDDKWQCDKIECPLDAHRCFVSKSNENDPSVVVRVNTCYSKDNQVLVNEVFKSPADPKSQIKLQITSTRDGSTVTNNGSMGDFDEEKFNAEMQELQENLQQMNADIQSNIQKEMENLQNDLNKMHYELAHMFD